MTLKELQAINTEVNKIPYVAGLGPTEPVDYWSYIPEKGKSWVCRDYVEAKAQQIRDTGMESYCLRTLLTWTEPLLPPPNEREYHAVLAVTMMGEVWILDSRFDPIYRWNAPPVNYKWDRIQLASSNEFELVTAEMVG